MIEIEAVDAFRYPRAPLERRHGPAGYADYRSYRPWLRDEFTFRCVYCLIREQWGRVTGEFDLDHFVPQIRDSSAQAVYDNLLYSCRVCNLRKGIEAVPDPSRALTAETIRVYPDGTVSGLTDDARRIIRTLCLNSPAWLRWRRIWIRIVQLAAESDEVLLGELLGFPSDLPNLNTCRTPENTHPAGVEQSYFARRELHPLPSVYFD